MIRTLERGSRAKHSAGGDDGSDRLPFVIELWNEAGDTPLRVLARAQNAALARVIFKAASAENPERKLTLRRDGRVLESTK